MQAETLKTKSETKNTADREITQSRVFNAPRELVFKAWTDPKHVDRWFGPRGFTTQTSEMDVRPGGVWRFVMRHPQHGNFTNKVVFLEVVKPERLVYDHGEDDSNPPHFRVTVTFTDRGQKTELTMHSIFPTAAARDKVVKDHGAIEGGQQTLDRFEEFLAQVSAQRNS
jgi:uncharacterized protein YndB with AHSA1/START domain